MSAAIRYARALFELAESAGQTQDVAQAAAQLQAGVGEKDAARALSNPRLMPLQRLKLAGQLAGAVKAPKLLKNTLEVLAEQNRLDILPQVLASFQQQADAAGNTARVKVQTARPLTAEQRKSIAALVKKNLKSTDVVVEESVQPELIGGFRAFFGGQVWDVSLAGGLARLKARFSQSLRQPR